jgi:pheromone a factor receptor
MSLNGIAVTLPAFRQKSTRKRESFDSFSDMAASFQDVGGALSDVKAKSQPPDLSYGALSLADVGGVLADYKPDPYSPTPSSGSSSSSFTDTSSPSEHRAPSFPEPAVTRPDPTIEISSVRGLSIRNSIVSPSIPEPVLDVSAIPRQPADTSFPAHPNPLDIV